MCDHGLTGSADCSDRDCRKRWLVGSTTADNFRPSPLPTLLLDVLETWCGSWLNADILTDHVRRIRPDCDSGTAERTARRIAQDGGAWWTLTSDRRDWIPVEVRFSTCSTGSVFDLRIPARLH